MTSGPSCGRACATSLLDGFGECRHRRSQSRLQRRQDRLRQREERIRFRDHLRTKAQAHGLLLHSFLLRQAEPAATQPGSGPRPYE